jgi:hypothetical protein
VAKEEARPRSLHSTRPAKWNVIRNETEKIKFPQTPTGKLPCLMFFQ